MELRRLEANQLVTVQQLEQQLHPPQVVHLPEPEPPVDLRVLVPGRPSPPPEIPFEELMAQAGPMLGPEPPPEEPMPDPRLEIAQRLGLSPPQT